MNTVTLRRSLRINASTNRCSPRLSRCSYGSKYTYRTSPRRRSNNKPNCTHTTPSKICRKVTKNKENKSVNNICNRKVSPYSFDELFQNFIINIKKEIETENFSQTSPTKQLDTKQENVRTPKRLKRREMKSPPSLVSKLDLDIVSKQQENEGPMTPPQKTIKEICSPPPLRRSNRKIRFSRNEFLTRKFLDFDLFA